MFFFFWYDYVNTVNSIHPFKAHSQLWLKTPKIQVVFIFASQTNAEADEP